MIVSHGITAAALRVPQRDKDTFLPLCNRTYTVLYWIFYYQSFESISFPRCNTFPTRPRNRSSRLKTSTRTANSAVCCKRCNATALSYLKIHVTISGARTEAIHRSCNRLQGRWYVVGTRAAARVCYRVQPWRTRSTFDLTLIRSMDPARPPDTEASALGYTYMPIARMYVRRSSRSVDRVYEL